MTTTMSAASVIARQKPRACSTSGILCYARRILHDLYIYQLISVCRIGDSPTLVFVGFSKARVDRVFRMPHAQQGGAYRKAVPLIMCSRPARGREHESALQIRSCGP